MLDYSTIIIHLVSVVTVPKPNQTVTRWHKDSIVRTNIQHSVSVAFFFCHLHEKSKITLCLNCWPWSMLDVTHLREVHHCVCVCVCTIKWWFTSYSLLVLNTIRFWIIMSFFFFLWETLIILCSLCVHVHDLVHCVNMQLYVLL